MKKFLLIGGGVLAVLIVAAGSYFLYFKKPTVAPRINISQPIVSGEPKTIKDLFSMSKQKCVFSDNAGSTGVVYIGESKLRADYTSTNGGTEIVSHIYTDGDKVYTWVEGQNKGFTLKFSDIADSSNPSGNPEVTNQKPLYDCSNWTVDASVFVIPAIDLTPYTPPSPEPTDYNNL